MKSVFYGIETQKLNYMDAKKEVKKYLNKYFKSQYINENDDEFKSLVRLLNKAQQAVKNCSIPPVMQRSELLSNFNNKLASCQDNLPSDVKIAWNELYEKLLNGA
jgi:hypothetical protein